MDTFRSSQRGTFLAKMTQKSPVCDDLNIGFLGCIHGLGSENGSEVGAIDGHLGPEITVLQVWPYRPPKVGPGTYPTCKIHCIWDPGCRNRTLGTCTVLRSAS